MGQPPSVDPTKSVKKADRFECAPAGKGLWSAWTTITDERSASCFIVAVEIQGSPDIKMASGAMCFSESSSAERLGTVSDV